MIAALPYIVAVLGLAVIAGGALTILRYERGKNTIRWCCRCAHQWFGTDTMCPECRGRGRLDPPPEYKIPSHDWQGHMDTGPIMVVPIRSLFDDPDD